MRKDELWFSLLGYFLEIALIYSSSVVFLLTSLNFKHFFPHQTWSNISRCSGGLPGHGGDLWNLHETGLASEGGGVDLGMEAPWIETLRLQLFSVDSSTDTTKWPVFVSNMWCFMGQLWK